MKFSVENCNPSLVPTGNTIRISVSPTINGIKEDFSDATAISISLTETNGMRGLPVKLESVSKNTLLLIVDGKLQRDGLYDLIVKYLKPDIIDKNDNSRTLRYFCAVKFYSRPVCESSGNTCPDVEIEPIEIDGEFQIGVTILPDNVAVYDENGDLKLRRNITLPENGKLLGTDHDQTEHVLAATMSYEQEDGSYIVLNELGNSHEGTNINSKSRPTFELPSSAGGKHEAAYLSDVSGGSSENTSARGSLAQVNDTLTFPISGIVCLLRRINQTEIEVFLTAAVLVTVNIFSVHFSPSGLEFVEYDDLTIPANGTLLTQTIGTNVKQIDARVTTEDSIYDIKANHTVDLTECTVTVSKFA